MQNLLLVLFFLDLAGTIAGIYAMQLREFDRKFMAISGGIMLGVGSFWIGPDIAEEMGATHALLTISVALAGLYAIDRYLYPICPCCHHDPRRNCRVSPVALLPLVIAISIHNFFDGWIAGLAGNVGSAASTGITAGLLAHKIPEGALFGMMLRSAANHSRSATVGAVVTASMILLGGLSHNWLPSATPHTLAFSLALTSASFLFLGGHIFWRQRQLFGARSALLYLAVGVVGAVVLDQGKTMFR